jgi:hypothetical protein
MYSNNKKKKFSRYVYLMESENYLKIGISFDPNTRRYRLNYDNNSSGENFVVVKWVDCLNGRDALALEKVLHEKFKKFQIITDLLGAKTECFSKEIKQDVLRELEIVDNYQSFDPFITCHPEKVREFFKINNTTLYDFCLDNFGRVTDTVMKKVKLSLGCILANFSIAGLKKVTCCKNMVGNLSSGADYCYRILKNLFIKDGVLDHGGKLIPNNIEPRYDVFAVKRVKLSYFRDCARYMVLIDLYSYKNNLIQRLTDAIDAKAESNMYKAYEVVVGGNNCVVRRK